MFDFFVVLVFSLFFFCSGAGEALPACAYQTKSNNVAQHYCEVLASASGVIC